MDAHSGDGRPARRAVLKSHYLVPVILIAIGAGAVAGSIGYGFDTESGQVGPGLWPGILGVVLVTLSVSIGVREARQVRTYATSGTTPTAEGVEAGENVEARTTIEPLLDAESRTEDQGGEGGRKLRRAILVMSGALLILPWVGFVAAMSLMVFGLMVGVDRRPYGAAAVSAVLCGAVIWLLFDNLLGVPLPGGFLSP